MVLSRLNEVIPNTKFRMCGFITFICHWYEHDVLRRPVIISIFFFAKMSMNNNNLVKDSKIISLENGKINYDLQVV